jgi:hypothetical protein
MDAMDIASSCSAILILGGSVAAQIAMHAYLWKLAITPTAIGHSYLEAMESLVATSVQNRRYPSARSQQAD